MKPSETHSALLLTARALLGSTLALALSTASLAGTTDIASAPLFTTATTKVKPNIMFVLDDSGSMAWDYMPDDANNFQLRPDGNSAAEYGKRTSQCNGLAFNPVAAAAPYDPPKNADGTDQAAGSLAFLSAGDPVGQTDYPTTVGAVSIVSSGALTVKVTSTSRAANWFFVGQVVTVYSSTAPTNYMVAKVTSWDYGTGNLGLNVAMAIGSGSLANPVVSEGAPANQVYYSYSGSQKALDFQYPGNKLVTASTFYKECNSDLGVAPGNAVFTAHIVTPDSTEAQRYANWNAYYRTRMLLMKTSVSRAFKDMDDKFRIGFTTIGEKGVTEGSKHLDIRDFVPKQKESFYTKLMATNPGGSTPLRGSLSKVGRYYAKKIAGQSYDPVQYSCQKNFTILSTDGYWNTGLESATYGPLALNGTDSVGQQDGGATLRPMFDGGTVTTTTKETWTKTDTWERTTATPKNTVSTSATTVTERTPKGTKRISYSLTTSSYSTVNNSDVQRCTSGSFSGGNCTITVTTSSKHGFSTGNVVTISGVNLAAYNGAFTITRLNDTSYTYTLTGLSSRPNNPSSDGKSGLSASGCAPGWGKQVETVQTRDEVAVVATTTTVTTTTPVSISTVVDRMVTTTPMTRTVIVVNGTQSSDTTVAGTTSAPTVTRISGPTTTAASGTPVVTSAATSTNSTEYTPWVNGSSTTQTTCSSSASPPTTPTANSPAATTASTTGPTTPVTTGPTPTDGAPVVTSTTPVSSDGSKTSSTTSSTSGANSDTLADVAMYYYQSDLRTDALDNCIGALGTSVCENNVTALGKDNARWQHMSTFTLSLGMNGTLQFDVNYDTDPKTDFLAITQGSKNWPAPGDDAGAVNIDDLWHAAVNGRGRYFSAVDPASLIASLKAALNTISAATGASSAAATSTLQPVEGDNGVYIAQFRSSEWTGDLRAYEINTKTGAIPTSTIDAQGNRVDLHKWSAAEQITPSTRGTIHYFKKGSGNTGTLREFTYANLTTDGLNGLFDNVCSKSATAQLSQCSGLSDAAKAVVDSGSNMVDFLRGQPHTEYRSRNQVLGDIVNSSPVYVGAPGFAYTENGYASFKGAEKQKTRPPTLYVGANDGMLHAINATNGKERWAYIPSMVMANMYKLGDQYYESKHQYFVDATPTAGDIYVDGAWKTILVGGLNAGGRGYYALDITDPLNPVALWEYTNDDLGLSYGNPIITKRKDGTWVVAFTSGYNNVSPGDGGGHLFVLNANTGALLKKISTGAGAADTPSGLGRLNGWVEFDTENLTQRYYAGDLLGNVWRFDIDDVTEPKSAALKLAQLQVEGVPQSITVAPQLAEVEFQGTRFPVVYIGTGRYLGKTDVSTTGVQSIYAIKDSLAATGLGDVRAGGTLVQQAVTTTSVRKVIEGSPVDWSSKNGWYVDLATAGERVNVDMQLAFNILTVAGNVPGTTASDCTEASSGTSWIYQLNVATGKGDAEFLSTMVAGLSTVQLSNGTGLTIITKTDASQPGSKSIEPALLGTGATRRSSWRELVD
ncbi:PilC/PilY family type IV pilus protein [Roseateles toxinivorans]|uniref:Type IV pilus assembly protein PilY1 n=1 Tax=Roseateles toxinivorans TaxID=270368 RepID=A0A4R6QIH1_9BURK|nr:PilC/PilY family type IV pilus protein [Roseateles toxinivorans]TDP62784.1 type IV pilus assembly protein PilY1 [Roseateles toxinivorans]